MSCGERTPRKNRCVRQRCVHGVLPCGECGPQDTELARPNHLVLMLSKLSRRHQVFSGLLFLASLNVCKRRFYYGCPSSLQALTRHCLQFWGIFWPRWFLSLCSPVQPIHATTAEPLFLYPRTPQTISCQKALSDSRFEGPVFGLSCYACASPPDTLSMLIFALVPLLSKHLDFAPKGGRRIASVQVQQHRVGVGGRIGRVQLF